MTPEGIERARNPNASDVSDVAGRDGRPDWRQRMQQLDKSPGPNDTYDDNGNGPDPQQGGQPVEGDVVWRLPPSLSGKKDKSAEELAALKAIGESDRMTLRFQKMDK